MYQTSGQRDLLLAITIEPRPRIRLLIQTPRRRTRIVHRRPSQIARILVLVATACRTVHNCRVVPVGHHQYKKKIAGAGGRSLPDDQITFILPLHADNILRSCRPADERPSQLPAFRCGEWFDVVHMCANVSGTLHQWSFTEGHLLAGRTSSSSRSAHGPAQCLQHTAFISLRPKSHKHQPRPKKRIQLTMPMHIPLLRPQPIKILRTAPLPRVMQTMHAHQLLTHQLRLHLLRQALKRRPRVREFSVTARIRWRQHRGFEQAVARTSRVEAAVDVEEAVAFAVVRAGAVGGEDLRVALVDGWHSKSGRCRTVPSASTFPASNNS